MRDSFHREIDYLRLSVTDRCNFRCPYCFPSEGIAKKDGGEILSFEEIVKLVRAARSLGMDKVRLTGGEPLMRAELPRLVKMIAEVGLNDLSLTTNGSRLAQWALPLARSGLDRVNVSIDAIDAGVFGEMAGRGAIEDVLEGIDAALSAGLTPLKLNAVLVEGLNDDQVLPLAEFALKKGVPLRFIGLMPIGEAARAGLRSVPLAEVRRKLKDRWRLEEVEGEIEAGNGPARYLRIGEGSHSTLVGFIFPVQSSFCTQCNKIRVTADGAIRPCLAHEEEIDLRDALEGSVKEVAGLLARGVREKPRGHGWAEGGRATESDMSSIGG